MRNYENKTKEDLLEIIEQLEKKIDFLSSHSSDSSSPSKGRFRDKYSTRIPVSYTHLRAHETGRNLV